MASISKQTISGDMEVSRNMKLGGGLEVTGKSEFGGRVTVKGFLDAPNLSVPCKGVFDTDTELKNTYPRPQSGWYAYVKGIDTMDDDTGAAALAETDDNGYVEYYVFRAYKGKWIESGTDYLPKTVEMRSYESRVEEIKTAIETLRAEVLGSSTSEDDGKSLLEQLEELETQVQKLSDNTSTSDAIKEIEQAITNMKTALTNAMDSVDKKMQTVVVKDDIYNGEDEDGNAVATSGKVLDKEQGDVLDAKIQALADAIDAIIGEEGGEGDSLASLKALIVLLQNGKWGGSVRFNGFRWLGKEELKEDYLDEMPEGIIWLCDKKMFVAVSAKVAVDCDCEKIVHSYWTDWDGRRFFMSEPGVEGALWKQKVYIHGGAVWVWKECEGQLVKAAGRLENVLSDEDIDEMMENFEFVDVGNPIYKVVAKGDAQLYLDAENNGNEAVVKGKVDIQDITEADVLKMFEKAEKEYAK